MDTDDEKKRLGASVPGRMPLEAPTGASGVLR
jgi:hypothetical protein